MQKVRGERVSYAKVKKTTYVNEDLHGGWWDGIQIAQVESNEPRPQPQVNRMLKAKLLART